MPFCLESLELEAQHLDAARQAVRKMAYQKWELAGRPAGDGTPFWLEAEREWIEYCYVPDRCDLLSSETALSAVSASPAWDQPSSPSAGEAIGELVDSHG